MGSALLRPARPGLVPRGCDALLPRGPIAYRLPTGSHQPTLQTLCSPAGRSRASSMTLLSSGLRRPPCLQLRLRAPACTRRCSTHCSGAPPPLGSLPTRPPAHSRGGPPGEPLPQPYHGRTPGTRVEEATCGKEQTVRGKWTEPRLHLHLSASSSQAGSPAPYL